MDSNFSDSQRAVAYVASGLESTFPNGEFELIAFRGTHVVPRHLRSNTHEVKPILDRLCHDYRGVSVRFTPESTNGLVATLESHPEFIPGGLKSKHPEENPKVVILLRHDGEHEILAGAQAMPPVQPYRSI
jgi:hypothetical protein